MIRFLFLNFNFNCLFDNGQKRPREELEKQWEMMKQVDNNKDSERDCDVNIYFWRV